MSSQQYKDKLQQFYLENAEIKNASMEGENTSIRIAQHYRTLLDLLRLLGIQEILEAGDTTTTGTVAKLLGGVSIADVFKVSSDIGLTDPNDPPQQVLTRLANGDIKLKPIEEFAGGGLFDAIKAEIPATPFIFTPTDDFTLSEIKTALEADGWKWNDSRILIELGTNNFTCNIDVTTPTMVTIERNGTGSISFTGTNLSFGTEGISILTNSQISMALLKIISGTTKMIRISNKT